MAFHTSEDKKKKMPWAESFTLQGNENCGFFFTAAHEMPAGYIYLLTCIVTTRKKPTHGCPIHCTKLSGESTGTASKDSYAPASEKKISRVGIWVSLLGSTSTPPSLSVAGVSTGSS